MTTTVVFGDSITAGSGASDAAHAYCFTAGARLGWTVTAKGVGGTGYVAGGVNNYPSRVQADVIALAPDIVVVQGGTNDYDYWLAPTPTERAAAMLAAASALYATIRAGLPNAKLYVLGMFKSVDHATGGGNVGTPDVYTMSAALQAAAVSVGAVWIDPIAGRWRTGDGSVGGELGDGNSDVYIVDGTHPTPAGHDYIGARLAFAIRPPNTGLDF